MAFDEMKVGAESENGLFYNEPIDGTPLVIRKDEEGWFVTLGKYIIFKRVGTREELDDILKSPTWEHIFAGIAITIESLLNKSGRIEIGDNDKD